MVNHMVLKTIRRAIGWGMLFAFAAAAAVAGWAKAVGDGPDAGPVLLRSGFEEGLAGWVQDGRAEFAPDRREHHGGERSARITVAPAVETHYQQLQHEIPRLAPRDRLIASVWVRTLDLADGAGAYMAVEFLGAGGQRVDIAHSKVGRSSGGDGWEKLTAEAVVPDGAATARLLLVVHSHGTAWFDDAEVTMGERPVPWPDLGGSQREVVIHLGRVVQPDFGGVGFHVFDHVHDASRQLLDEVIEKRWRELNPSFARLNHDCYWDRRMLDRVADRMRRLQWTGAEVYLATWNPKDVAEGDQLAAYARKVVDSLEYLVRSKGLTNVKYYCMSNELSLGRWGALRDDLPRFKAYHQALFDELKARGLDIGLLATDASPISSWDTIDWAAGNMDDITGVYGGHHYIREYGLDDERFYPWFLSKMQWGADLARRRGKGFILGEFGCKQAPPELTVGGKKMDTCAYWDTPQEPLVSIQLTEAVIAAINGGVHAAAYWTFADFPDQYTPAGGVPDSSAYANKWGVFRWHGDDCSTRAHYYAYGLLTKFFRGPATAYEVSTNDPRLRVAAIKHHADGTWSIAVVNRNNSPVPVVLQIDGAKPAASFRKYVYDPNNIPSHPFGDLQGPSGKVAMKDGRLADTVGPMTLSVYTTAYDDDLPAPVQGLKVEAADGVARRLTWQPCAVPDLCYYRVFRSERPDFSPDVRNQIGSTIATTFTDARAEPGKQYQYKVLAVDTSGNASPPD
jgi:hypothetical protein